MVKKHDVTQRPMMCGHDWWGIGVRGVCGKCYSEFTRQIRFGETTWAKLEKKGLVKKPYLWRKKCRRGAKNAS